MKKVEISWLEHCNKCGCGVAIVETAEGNENLLFDGDKISCPACGHTGHVAVTDDYADDCVAFAEWDDLPVIKHVEMKTDVLP